MWDVGCRIYMAADKDELYTKVLNIAPTSLKVSNNKTCHLFSSVID